MAYYLNFDAGTDTRVNIPELIPIGSTAFSIKLEWAPTALTSNFNPLISSDTSTVGSRNAIYQRSNGELEIAFIIGGARRRINTAGAGLQTGVRAELDVVYDGTTLSSFINGTPVGSTSATGTLGGDNGITVIGDNRAESSARMNFHGLTAEYGGAQQRNYDPSASNGTGQILPDTVGGNDGTLVNFPTDNSQWVFYDDGGGAVTADVAYTINAPTFTSSASVTLPAPIANASFALASPTFSASADASLPQPIVNGAFSIASPLFSSSADASLPQPISNAAFTLNAPTFSASATATIPGFNASIAYSVNAPTFAADATVTLPSPQADVTYTVTSPTFSVDSSVTLPQPTANAAFSLPTPTFTASATATEPGFNAAVNFTLPTPTFSADATATLPQPIADGNFTITAPTFSVVAIVGGIAIIVDNETNINMPALSTNINAPVLSNNVRI